MAPSRLLVIPAHGRGLAIPTPHLVNRVFPDPQPRSHLRNRLAPLGDLKDRIALEVLGEVRIAHRGLLASKLGKKASTNLWAIQCCELDPRKPFTKHLV